MSLRIPLTSGLPHKFAGIDVRLRNGTIIENLAIDASGLILGKIVGGHDGIDDRPLPFQQEEIEAYRLQGGLKARLGLNKWHRIEPGK